MFFKNLFVFDSVWIIFYVHFIVLKSTEASKEEVQRIRDNLFDLDRYLGPYPYQNLRQWNRLVCNISGKYVMYVCMYVSFLDLAVME